jgi:tetratricopeptide (TPR) repeat protein
VKVSEFALKLNIKMESILDIIREAGVAANTIDDELNNDDITKLVQQIEKFTDALKSKEGINAAPAPDTAEQPVPKDRASEALHTAHKKVNPSLEDLSKNLDVELDLLIQEAKRMGITVSDPSQELNEDDGARLLDGLKITQDSIKKQAPEASQPAPKEALAAAPAVAGPHAPISKNDVRGVAPNTTGPAPSALPRPQSPAVSFNILDVLQSPYFIAGVIVSTVIIFSVISYSVKKESTDLPPVAASGPVSADEKTMMGLIWKMFDEGSYQSAYTLCGNFKTEYPDSRYLEDVTYKAADILFSWKREPQSVQYKAAIKAFEDAVKRWPYSPKAPRAVYMVGQAYQNMKLYGQSRVVYHRVLHDYPSYDRVDEVQFALAESYSAQKEYAKAVTEYVRLINKYPSSSLRAQAYARMGFCFGKLEKFDQAFNAYNKFLSLAPNGQQKDETLLAIGSLYYEVGRYPEAIDAFKKITGRYAYDRNNAQAAFMIAESLAQQKDFAGARAILLELVYGYQNNSLAEKASFTIADYFLRENDLARADDFIHKALKKYPQSRMARDGLLGLGTAFLARKNYDKALDMYTELMVRYPTGYDNSRLMMYLARTYNGKKMYRAGADVLGSLVKNYPNSSFTGQALSMQAQAYFDGGFYAQARQAYIKKLTAYSRNSEKDTIYYKLGECSYLLGEYDAAIGYLQEGINKKIFGKYRYLSRFLMAKSFLAQKENKKAAEQYEALVNNDFLAGQPIYYAACLELSALMIEAKSDDKALVLCDKVIAGGPGIPGYAEAVRNKAYVLARLGRKKEAVAAYDAALAQWGKWQPSGQAQKLAKQAQIAGCRLRLGDILFQMKDIKGALAQYLAAYHKVEAADDAWAIFQIANAYKELGDQKMAQEFYNRLKTEYPDNYWLGQMAKTFKAEAPIP